MMSLTKHPGGRPTKYDPSFIKRAIEYINSCNREATELPTIEGLALQLGLDDERISEYAEKYPEFDATIKALKKKQKNQLMNDGMYGGKDVNSAMAIFLLKANHGLMEASRTEITGANGQPLAIITGTGFIPAGVVVDATPEAGTASGQPSIQGASLAPEGQKDHNGNL